MRAWCCLLIICASLLATKASRLHEAAAKGDVAAVAEYLDNYRELNKRDDKNRTPLHYAAMNGHHILVELLVRQFVNLNIRDIDGKTPRMLAEERGHAHVAQLLKSAGGIATPLPRSSENNEKSKEVEL